jgi:alpha-mannosidase
MGYIPDQYIQLAQMPQLFRGFGIEHAAFARGMANQYDEIPGLTCEFNWEGSDGSQVLAFNLRAGYGHNAHLGKNPEQTLNIMVMSHADLNKIPWSTNLRLSFHGSDHTGPEESIIDAIETWNNEEEIVEENGRLKLASWDDFLTDFKKLNPELKTVKGELMGRRYQITLHGVFSSNVHIKQRNFAIHDILERWSEPFSVFASLYGHMDMRGFIRESWKWLLQNQPHDTIWTSSTDQSMREMITRFDWAEQMAEDAFRRSAQWIVQHLTPTSDQSIVKIVVFNPHPWPRTDIIHARYSEKGGTSNVILLDEENHEITARILSADAGDSDRYRRRVYVPSHNSLGHNFHEIIFSAENIPPLGYKTYFIRKRDPRQDLFEPPEPGLLDGNDFYLENEVLRLTVEEDGTLTVVQKQGEEGLGIKHLHLLEDISDIGDGWEFAPIKDDIPVISKIQNLKSTLLEATEQIGTLQLEYCIQIPEGVMDNDAIRSPTLIDLNIVTLISLRRGNVPIIEFKTSLINVAKNHRLRVLFPTSFKADQITVNGHFGTLTRNITLPDDSKWGNKPEPTVPFQKFISLWDTNKNRGLTLLSKGISEYEPIQNEDGDITLALTLYRAVGKWGHHLNVVPRMMIPDAQLMNKELSFEYAIIPQLAPWDDEKNPVYRYAEEYYTPLRWEEDYDTYRFKPETTECILPFSKSLLEISPINIQLSSFKQAEKFNDDALILRVFNINQTNSEASITCHIDIDRVEFCDLKEDPLTNQPEFTVDQNVIKFELDPWKIATMKIFVKK